MSFEQFMQFGSGASGIASAASGVAGMIGGAIQGRKNRKLARQLQRQQLEWQREENKLAFDRSVEMWNMQNAYNSPSAQMERLQEAGLNPNLAYGSLGDANATNAPQASPVQVPSLSDAAYNNPYDSFTAGAASLAQASQVMSTQALQEAQTKKLNYESVAQAIINSQLPSQLKAQLNVMLGQYEKDKETLNLIRSQVAEVDTNIKLMNQTFDKVNKELLIMDEHLKGLKIDNFVRAATQDSRIKQIIAQSEISQAEAKTIMERLTIEIQHGHLTNRGLDAQVWQLATDKALRQAGLAVEWQNKLHGLIAEGHEIDAREYFGQMLKQISPEQAKRVIAHQTSFIGDVTYFITEILQPMLSILPKFSKSSQSSTQSNGGSYTSSSSNINSQW